MNPAICLAVNFINSVYWEIDVIFCASFSLDFWALCGVNLFGLFGEDSEIKSNIVLFYTNFAFSAYFLYYLVQRQFFFHLLLVVACFFTCYGCEILAAVSKNDGAACVYEQSAVAVHTIFAYLFE